jgi:hypothetical protein
MRAHCPHRRAQRGTTAMEELIAFVCSHWGESVGIELARIQ